MSTAPATREPLHRAAIGLGANLPSPAGPPADTLRAAAASLEELGTVTALSLLYRTEPVLPPGHAAADQPIYLNAAAMLQTTLDPHALLEALLAIERRFGRDRAHTPPKGPRTLDLDLLLYDEQVLTMPGLILPHPALPHRRFVLAPLAEIAPDLLHPVLRQPMRALLEALPDEGPNRRAAVHALPSI